jgi:PAS domain S-box-containing protein
MSNDLSEKMKDLRQKAEFIINEKKEIKENISNQDLSNIIHDLSVYQIELELQNEELRNTQKELEQTRNNYIDLFNQSPNGYITLSDIGQIIQVNSTFADMIGVDASTLIRKNFNDYIIEEDKPEFLGRFKAFFKNPDGKFIEIRLKRVHTEPIFVSISGRIVNQQNLNSIENKPNLLLSIIDITERKQAEEALRKNESLNEQMLKNIGDVIVIIDKDGINRYKSPNIEQLFGWKPEDLVGNSTWDNVHPEDLQAGMNFISSLMVAPNTTGTIELRYKKKNGTFCWIEITIVNLLHDNDVQGFLGNYHDITERKQAEEALRENQSKLEIAMSSAKMAWWEMDISTGNVVFDKRKTDMLGYTPENFKHYKDFTDLVHHDDYNGIMNAMQSHLDGLSEKYETEYRIKTNSGDYKWFYDIGTIVIWDSNGSPLKVTGLVLDISERKKTEDALKESEEKFRKIFENSGDGIFFLSFTTDIVKINDSFARMHGYTIDEMKDIKLEELDVDDLSQVLPERFERISKGENLQFEVRHYHKDGHIIELEVVTCLITLENEKLIVAIHRDITERKQVKEEMELLLEQLRETNELIETNLYEKNALLEVITESEAKLRETVATKDKFFSIIAHDLRSPFTGLLGLTDLMSEENEGWTVEEIKTMSEEINKSANSLFKLIEDLLAWSLTQTGMTQIISEELDLYEISLNTTFSLNQTAKNKNIKLIQNIKQGTFFTGDRNMLTTVFRNLVSNSIKFTRENGIIEIGIEEASNELEDNYVVFVKDNGIGMSKENQSNLFKIEKHISTKGTNNESGTGLGLILCKEFVEKHGGRIWVESEEGIGSTFYFSLKK